MAYVSFNTLRLRQDGLHFPDDIFNCIFLNENVQISIKISLKFVPKGPINNIPALVQIMAWRRPGDKPLSEPMMVSLLMHICVTRPQWVKKNPKLLALWHVHGALICCGISCKCLMSCHSDCTYICKVTQHPIFQKAVSLRPPQPQCLHCVWRQRVCKESFGTVGVTL